jgi:GntR family transcriptional regulator, transcriptional repressor for pyruvate dehydrogenase complex
VSFSPVSRRSLTDEVFDQLVAGIVSGELPAGEPLPAERRLAEALGVSRPAGRGGP